MLRTMQRKPNGLDAHPLKTHKATLEFLRLLHEGWLRNQNAYGLNIHTAIVRLALIGWIEERPYDLSSIAVAIQRSRQQTARRVAVLIDEGWLVEVRTRNRAVVSPTLKTINKTRDELSTVIPKVIAQFSALRRMWDEDPLAPPDDDPSQDAPEGLGDVGF